MKVTFLVYTDNAVYQICTPKIKSHGPDKGIIWVAAVSGLAHCFRWHASLSGSLRLFKFQCEAYAKSLAKKKQVNFCQKLEYELHTNMANMQKYADGDTVPHCCKRVWV